MMQHPLVPFEIFSIESLCKNISHLVMGFSEEHPDSPKAHLLFSKMIRNMKMPVLFGDYQVICPFNAGTVVLHNRSRFLLRTAKINKKMPEPHNILDC